MEREIIKDIERGLSNNITILDILLYSADQE